MIWPFISGEESLRSRIHLPPAKPLISQRRALHNHGGPKCGLVFSEGNEVDRVFRALIEAIAIYDGKILCKIQSILVTVD